MREEFAAPHFGDRHAKSFTRVPRLAPWQELEAKKLMLDHLADPINVGDIASRCRVSRGYFISAFGASTGLTPHQWVIACRIHRAKKLLRASNLPLAEIAVACGFYDQSHFSRSFARFTGDPPGRWRRAEKSLPQSDALRSSEPACELAAVGTG